MADDTSSSNNSVGQDISSILSNLASNAGTGIQYGLNQNLQNDLMSAAIDNLTQFASSVQAKNNPDLTSYINDQIKLAQQGQISPAQAMAAVQKQSNMLGVEVPQNFTDSVNSALAQEQQVAQQGYTPVERAAIQNALNGVIGQEKGEQAAIKSDAQARGQYGGGQALDQEQEALQGAINNASAVGNQVEANAYTRALTALQNEGELGLTAGQQSFTQQGAKATAQDQINSLNAQLQQQANLQNAQNTQQAHLQESAQQNARDLADQQSELELNQQKVAAANQTVQNQQGQENIAGGAIKQAGSDAASMEPAVYAQTQKGEQTLSQGVLGPNSGVQNTADQLIKGLTGSGGGSSGGTNLSSLYGPGAAAAARLAGLNSNQNTIASGYTPDGSYDPTYADSQVQQNIDQTYQNNQNYLDSQPAPQFDFSGADTSGAGSFDYPSGTTTNFGTDAWSASDPSYMDFSTYSEGGDVEGPGTETSDSIPVRLSNHEYVINADSAKKYKPLVEAINDDDHDAILDTLLPLIVPDEHSMVVVTPKGKKIGGEKALSDALKALASLNDE
jgi:hypothetical protein